MSKRHAFIVMRMFVRLNEQATHAWMFGREADAHSICKLIGRLEYIHFEGACISLQPEFSDRVEVSA